MSEPTIQTENSGKATAPVYSRLQKRAEGSRKHGAQRRRDFFIAVLLGFGMLAAAAVIWMGSRLLETDPRFRLHEVELTGTQYVTTAEVNDLFAVDRDHSLIQIPLSERRHQLEAIPWVRSTTLIRILPDRLRVIVEERTPVAFLWTAHGIALVDAHGVILDTPADSSFSFPVVSGLSEQESPQQRSTKMQRFIALSAALSPAGAQLADEISEVELGDPQDLAIIVTSPSGAIRLQLGEEKFQERYERFKENVSQWRAQFGQIDSIDMQFDGQAVVHAGTPRTVSLSKGARAGAAAGAHSPSKPAASSSHGTPPARL